MALRTLFKSEGQKKREKKIIARQHKLKEREKREKFFDNSRELLG